MVYRAVIIAVVALTASGAFATGWLPNILGAGGAAKTGSGGGVTPPSSCTNKLDFSVACNSQYIGAL